MLASFAGAAAPRYREVMQSLVRHLHAFAREVRLTESEWQQGIDFLTRAGHITDDRRQEFILLSDVLGLSMLTVAINAPASAGATESTVVGPFFVADAPEVPLGGDIAGAAKGQPCYVSGTVQRHRRRADARGPHRGVGVRRGRLLRRPVPRRPDRGTRAGCAAPRTAGTGSGRCARRPIRSLMTGPVGDLLTAAGRGPMRPAHLHFKVEAPGYRTLITHIFVAGDPYLDRDAVFGVKESLITEFAEHPPGTRTGRAAASTGRGPASEFDIVLARLAPGPGSPGS